MKNLKVADIVNFCACVQVTLSEIPFLISIVRIFICNVSAIFSSTSKKSVSLNKNTLGLIGVKVENILSNCPHYDFFFFFRPLGILENAALHCNALFISRAINRLSCVLRSEYLEACYGLT